MGKRFQQVFCKFKREGKEENCNKVVFLLDGMLRHEYIAFQEYESLNNILVHSLVQGFAVDHIEDEPEYRDDE